MDSELSDGPPDWHHLRAQPGKWAEEPGFVWSAWVIYMDEHDAELDRELISFTMLPGPCHMGDVQRRVRELSDRRRIRYNRE